MWVRPRIFATDLQVNFKIQATSMSEPRRWLRQPRKLNGQLPKLK